jgi:outer membrane protein assembly factor BamA
LRSGANATGGQSFSAVGTASLYKSIDLPGFAHHVIALRGAAGVADNRTNGYYSVGGVSGSPFQVVPGYVLGEGRKTFPVRGFLAGSVIGTRAFTGSLEYRMPLWLLGGSPGIFPFFFDRSSLTLFGDYGSAWCPTISTTTEVCNRTDQDRRIRIGSAGAEINLNLGVLSWDSPYRFRLGVAHPVQNGAFFERQPLQVYLVSGLSF